MLLCTAVPEVLGVTVVVLLVELAGGGVGAAVCATASPATSSNVTVTSENVRMGFS